jgi:hypothetical protein
LAGAAASSVFTIGAGASSDPARAGRARAAAARWGWRWGAVDAETGTQITGAMFVSFLKSRERVSEVCFSSFLWILSQGMGLGTRGAGSHEAGLGPTLECKSDGTGDAKDIR